MIQNQFHHDESMREQRKTQAAINDNTQATRDLRKEFKNIFRR